MNDPNIKKHRQATWMILLLILSATSLSAQQESFDLITYTAPEHWTKEARENAVSYISINRKNNSWCRLCIYKSTASKGNIESDFESEWDSLVAKTYNTTGAPQVSEA